LPPRFVGYDVVVQAPSHVEDDDAGLRTFGDWNVGAGGLVAEGGLFDVRHDAA
jgi:hypothetical protein